MALLCGGKGIEDPSSIPPVYENQASRGELPETVINQTTYNNEVRGDNAIIAQGNTSGGDFNIGNKTVQGDEIHGDKAAGDKFGGDKVMGDKFTGNKTVNNNYSKDKE